jgi:hypothetical protein
MVGSSIVVSQVLLYLVRTDLALASTHVFACHLTLLLLHSSVVALRLLLLLLCLVLPIQLVSILVGPLLIGVHHLVIAGGSDPMVVVILMVVAEVRLVLELSPIVTLGLFYGLHTLIVASIGGSIVRHIELDG